MSSKEHIKIVSYILQQKNIFYNNPKLDITDVKIELHSLKLSSSNNNTYTLCLFMKYIYKVVYSCRVLINKLLLIVIYQEMQLI